MGGKISQQENPALARLGARDEAGLGLLAQGPGRHAQVAGGFVNVEGGAGGVLVGLWRACGAGVAAGWWRAGGHLGLRSAGDIPYTLPASTVACGASALAFGADVLGTTDH